MTPATIISLALKLAGVLGVGQTPLQQDTDDAFTLLNMMVGQWAQKRYLVYHEVDVVCVGNGFPAYSIGPGGNFDTPRPDKIESAFVRMSANSSNPVDYPLDIIAAREDWNLLPYKGLHGMPMSVFYDAGYPAAYVYINPLPDANYEIHLTVKQALTSFANQADDIALPAQYQEALLYNLAGRLAPMYQVPPNPVTVALASAALNTIRNSNAQVARLQMPRGLPGMGRRGLGLQLMGGTVGLPVATGAGLTGVGVLNVDGIAGWSLTDPDLLDGVGLSVGSGSNSAGSSVLGVGVLGQMILGA